MRRMFAEGMFLDPKDMVGHTVIMSTVVDHTGLPVPSDRGQYIRIAKEAQR